MFALSVGMHAQKPKPKGDDSWTTSAWPPLTSLALTVSAPATRSAVIYANPKDGRILMEFFDEHDNVDFTVYTDGTVKKEKGADLDADSKAFWKNMADAFAAWKISACSESAK